MSNEDSDQVQRFHFGNTAVRGEIVRIGTSLREILGQHFYPAPVARLLGETLAASVLLSSTLKFNGTLSLQAKSSGPVSLLFGECSHDRRLRGYASVLDGSLGEDFSQLLRDGTLAITITPDQGQRYQGIVPLDAPELAGCLEHYFDQSEQLPSALWLACDGQQAAGLLLQVLPEAAAAGTAQQPQLWEHLRQLANTLSPRELLEQPFSTLLYHLFHEQQVRVQPALPVAFGCRCSEERAGTTLRSLGEAEARAVLDEQGLIRIHCEFCQQEYCFDEAALQDLFAAGRETTVH